MLGVLAIVVATIAPWFVASTVGGSATLAGWGSWQITGDLNASLRPLPLAVLVYLPAGFMVYGAWRRQFGVALLGGLGTVAAAALPFGIRAIVDRRVPGSDSVALSPGTAPLAVLAIGLLVTTVCWIAYARFVLRAAPKS